MFDSQRCKVSYFEKQIYVNVTTIAKAQAQFKKLVRSLGLVCAIRIIVTNMKDKL